MSDWRTSGEHERTPDEGLEVQGKLDLEDSEVAREAWRSMKRNRVALSFGYLVTGDRKRRDGVRELTELDLFEVTITPSPANPATRILSTKSAADDRHGEEIAAIFREFSHNGFEEFRKREEIEKQATKGVKAARPIQVASFEC